MQANMVFRENPNQILNLFTFYFGSIDDNVQGFLQILCSGIILDGLRERYRMLGIQQGGIQLRQISYFVGALAP